MIKSLAKKPIVFMGALSAVLFASAVIWAVFAAQLVAGQTETPADFKIGEFPQKKDSGKAREKITLPNNAPFGFYRVKVISYGATGTPIASIVGQEIFSVTPSDDKLPEDKRYSEDKRYREPLN
ncbi:MAG: hypothetical protein A3I89_04175 [Candidatus Harrisonbacteria bacterium RIFCSPLOWO2_02_FULL_41_11]|uniref:Uncharacterized protein n=1 Tax=Candidatus Harrisonbacteria bacterium RIFCSPHIGHO2_02_FULL_42_16 TaxID=1798404 RepID=A0A1G1ZI99_9BACT|nr:MAG: hypothetical protein A3B92_01230 [Candidatus Harrisonbacteria bacterium RIFCSPHIGHO2_02_FULL_42_16]OGY67175.1 MAG: hypothetical protein A3I89_04175 [Candidatus Harrisonbacteria bacterium RIFCSPLOWO2_02_FULL_41_11]